MCNKLRLFCVNRVLHLTVNVLPFHFATLFLIYLCDSFLSNVVLSNTEIPNIVYTQKIKKRNLRTELLVVKMFSHYYL